MTSTSPVSAPPSDRALVLTRTLKAPPALVFAAWTQPERLAHWLGPTDFTAHSIEMDLRVGGEFSAIIRAPEGTDYPMRCRYRDIDEPRRLVLTFAWEERPGTLGHETLITLTFAEHPRGTEMTFRQETFLTVNDRDSHRGGWSECFDRLADYLALH